MIERVSLDTLIHIVVSPASLCLATIGGSVSSGRKFNILETRSLDDCQQCIETHRGCLVALEVDPEACQRAAEWLWRVRQTHQDAAVIVVLPTGYDEVGWFLRQMGAVHVITSTLELRHSRRLIQRHLSRFRELPLSLEERIWNNLPWRASRADDIS